MSIKVGVVILDGLEVKQMILGSKLSEMIVA